jgi:hypothetical protein
MKFLYTYFFENTFYSTVILKIVPKATSNISSDFPSLSLVDFFQGTFMAGFQNNFQALSMQLLVSLAAIRKLEQAY